ncbi:hypothetical protein [Aquimarina mytili]|uniref:Uncharacterized protein n=1 Tax=Aquimarina mytili TaxID=874423 RepID=A0A937D9J8_9FLAO|nr:hypothetical protein [Aquimarina mytili]MBL0683787.1 hypothetical protein [Aquimarina mytili]
MENIEDKLNDIIYETPTYELWDSFCKTIDEYVNEGNEIPESTLIYVEQMLDTLWPYHFRVMPNNWQKKLDANEPCPYACFAVLRPFYDDFLLIKAQAYRTYQENPDFYKSKNMDAHDLYNDFLGNPSSYDEYKIMAIAVDDDEQTLAVMVSLDNADFFIKIDRVTNDHVILKEINKEEQCKYSACEYLKICNNGCIVAVYQHTLENPNQTWNEPQKIEVFVWKNDTQVFHYQSQWYGELDKRFYNKTAIDVSADEAFFLFYDHQKKSVVKVSLDSFTIEKEHVHITNNAPPKWPEVIYALSVLEDDRNKCIVADKNEIVIKNIDTWETVEEISVPIHNDFKSIVCKILNKSNRLVLLNPVDEDYIKYAFYADDRLEKENTTDYSEHGILIYTKKGNLWKKEAVFCNTDDIYPFETNEKIVHAALFTENINKVVYYKPQTHYDAWDPRYGYSNYLYVVDLDTKTTQEIEIDIDAICFNEKGDKLYVSNDVNIGIYGLDV